jgi:prepilin-type N-terminal cleavage/methylation domain-containing protein
MKLRYNKSKSRGFTMIEMLVVLAILSMLALLASNAFDGSRSKAQVMVGLGKQVGDANIQLKTDTGCYVNMPKALFDPAAAASTSNNYCARSFGSTWARPYLGQYTVDGAGAILADKVGAGVTVSLKRETGGMGGSGKRYFVHFENVPTDVIRQALIECNNSDAVGSFDNNRCRVDGDLSGETGKFDMLYDTTR